MVRPDLMLKRVPLVGTLPASFNLWASWVANLQPNCFLEPSYVLRVGAI